MLASDLLADKGLQKESATRKFLLGTVSSVINLCCQQLSRKLDESGGAAFDALYLQIDGKEGKIVTAPEERRLFPGILEASISQSTFRGGAFSGSTEFFFLTAGLLRVSLFPYLRAQRELLTHNRALLNHLREIAVEADSNNTRNEIKLSERERSVTDAYLGWIAVLEDPEFVKILTSFSLLQLRWLTSVVDTRVQYIGSGGPVLTFQLIPEWFCKLPAEWIAFAATRAASTISLADGVSSVECATRLLQLCNRQGDVERLSAPVITELIRIPGAFVRAGVDRAKRRVRVKEYRKNRGRPLAQQQRKAIDERTLDVYLSFDRNDLGVTVFTNKFVQMHLGPTLVETFCTMDAIEGMDVEREHNFDKFAVKGEIAELIMRLWRHPSGEARDAIRSVADATLGRFLSSIAAALGLIVDNACHQLMDVKDILKHWELSSPLTPRAKSLYNFHANAVASGLASGRKLLLLLCYLSEEDNIARLSGGTNTASNLVGSAAKDLAQMILNFIDRFTCEDGTTTNSDLDFRRQGSEKLPIGDDLIKSRRFVWMEFGLDISVFMHLLLALAARWHKVSTGDGNEKTWSSIVSKCFVASEDCSVDRLRSIVQRFVIAASSGSFEKSAESDGHVNFSLLTDEFERPCSGGEREWPTAQNQISHAWLGEVASVSDILQLLSDVDLTGKRFGKTNNALPDEAELLRIEECVLSKTYYCQSEDYTESLSDWGVNSEPFIISSEGDSFAHFFDVPARSSSSAIGSSRTLIKEAKMCKRLLPPPHPDASIFVCFAEERMDLCRSIVTGAAETPYSLGLFVFDVFFPPSYPVSPPLVTFMTTGKVSGRIRRCRLTAISCAIFFFVVKGEAKFDS